MADLINRAALLEQLDDLYNHCGHCDGYGYISKDKAMEKVKAAPAVNPFEHLQEMICEGCNQQFSDEPCEPDECLILAALRTYVNETDFCSYGERSTDGESN